MGIFAEPLLKRQAAVLDDLEGLDASIVAIVERTWSKIVAALRSEPTAAKLNAMFRRVFPELEAEMEGAFEEMARNSYRSAAVVWAETLPDSYLLFLLKPAKKSLPLAEAETEQDVLFPEDRNNLFIRLFPPPSAKRVKEVVHQPFHGKPWTTRLESWSKKITDNEGLSTSLAAAYAKGANLDQLTKVVRPYVQNIGSSARRIARTEGMRIADEMAEETYQQASGVIQGFQRHATLDDVTRPEHAALHGKTYDRDDSSRPRLPDEPNCRCWYEPVLKSDEDIEKLKGTGAAPGPEDGTPEQQSAFGSWFDSQPPARQKAVVGPLKWGKLVEPGQAKLTWQQVQGAGAPARKAKASPRVTTRPTRRSPQARPSRPAPAARPQREEPPPPPSRNEPLVTVQAARPSKRGEPLPPAPEPPKGGDPEAAALRERLRLAGEAVAAAQAEHDAARAALADRASYPKERVAFREELARRSERVSAALARWVAAKRELAAVAQAIAEYERKVNRQAKRQDAKVRRQERRQG